MSRPKGRVRDCSAADARARLSDARQFLKAAELLTAAGNGDVVATNAVHAAIAAADVLCCLALGRRSADGNHESAVVLLEQVSSDHANQLRRALARKQQAAYESRDLADTEARICVEAARRLTAAATAAVERL